MVPTLDKVFGNPLNRFAATRITAPRPGWPTITGLLYNNSFTIIKNSAASYLKSDHHHCAVMSCRVYV